MKILQQKAQKKTYFFTLLITQGAPACGFSRMVSGVGGASYLQSVPGPDSRPPSALLPW